MKSVQDMASAINFGDASMIDWLSKKGVCEALKYHGEDLSELKNWTCITRLCFLRLLQAK